MEEYDNSSTASAGDNNSTEMQFEVSLSLDEIREITAEIRF